MIQNPLTATQWLILLGIVTEAELLLLLFAPSGNATVQSLEAGLGAFILFIIGVFMRTPGAKPPSPPEN